MADRCAVPIEEVNISEPVWTNSARLVSIVEGVHTRLIEAGRSYAIGRGASADVMLDHASVSRHHALLEADDEGRWRLHDMGSHNGTVVNGQRITQQSLSHGDQLQIGAISFIFEQDHKLCDATAASPMTAELDDADELTIHRLDQQHRPLRMSSDQVLTILSFGRLLDTTEEQPQRLQQLMDLAVSPALGGRWAYALRISASKSEGAAPSKDGLSVEPLAFPKTAASAASDEPRVSRSVLRAIFHGRDPVLASTAATSSSFEAEMTALPQANPFGAIACPLASAYEGSMDVLYVFLPLAAANVEWLMLYSLAVQQYRNANASWAAKHAAAESAVHQREMDLARTIQSHTLPAARTSTDVEWAVRFEPCLAVAGDYVDVRERADGTILCVVADASGKGVQAAMITAGLHAIFHTAGTATTLPDLIEAANDYLCRFLPGTSFVTLVALALDPRTGTGTCVNCGHLPLLAIDANGTVREISGGDNLPLGISREPIRSCRVTVADDECIVAYTDGLTELRNPPGEMLGRNALQAIIAQACTGSPSSTELVADQIMAALDGFGKDASAGDDQTLLVLRRRSTRAS